MARKIFHKLVTLEEARRRIESAYKVGPLGVETVKLAEALGRVLAEDIISELDVPPFDRSQMDGYAVLAQDTFGASEDTPRILRVVERVEAGERPRATVAPRQAVEIATGAPIPKGANAVVIVEHTRETDGKLMVFKPVTPGMSIIAAGSDISSGETILRRGVVLSYREIGVLAAAGLGEVPVFLKPKVAVISTGNELQEPGRGLEYGKVYDVNTYILQAALSEIGCSPIAFGVVGDRRSEIREKLAEALQAAHLVLTSGSTSAGFGDAIYQVLEEIKPEAVLVHGLAVKPGKPTVVAVVNGKLVIGLPGYPTSAMTIYHHLVRPLLYRMAGRGEDSGEQSVEAVLPFKTHFEKGRRELLPVYLVEGGGGGYVAYPILKGSGAVTSFSMADGYIDVPEPTSFLEEGDRVKVILYSSRFRPADLTFIGSHCAGVEALFSMLAEGPTPLRSKTVNVGSTAGLSAASRGEADIAGIHLLDESGDYNLPVIEKMGLQDKVHLVRGYEREQGFVQPKERPPVKGIRDIIERKIVFINRNQGSGTRILTDTLIRQYAQSLGLEFEPVKEMIINYDVEAKTHSAVAAAVSHGRADVGVAIRAYAERYGLSFFPLSREKYDFAIPRTRIEKPGVQKFIQALRSPEFSERLRSSTTGIVTTPETGKIIL